MKLLSLAVFVLLTVHLSNAESGTYLIEYSYSNEGFSNVNQWKKSGELLIVEYPNSNKRQVSLKTTKSRLIENESGQIECSTCEYRLRFVNKNVANQVFLAHVPASKVHERAHDFLEVTFSKSGSVVSLFYGLTTAGSLGDGVTFVKVIEPSPSPNTPDILFSDIDPSQPNRPDKPEEQQGFFKKYFWYIVIGGVVFFIFQGFDTSKLNEAMEQAQRQAGAQR
eukprot:TRINITY_DN7631_c0_g1_i1.p1 TRINITY_DN7631_c0_g1~~TRINITY_DN7631_c0_g1_i1.p1  ORF type:complete len:223 (-),score=51.43 TRINITY_DN7631_c0_g1_i1:87-755(-)